MDGGELLLWRKPSTKVEGKLGSGNADGVANPGERIAIAVPDGEAFRAVELFTSDLCVDNSERLLEPRRNMTMSGKPPRYLSP